MSRPQQLQAALQRVLQALAAPYAVREHSLTLSASIGVTLYPQDDEDTDTLVRHADQAMYVAKQRGRNRYHLFDVSQEQELKATHQTVARVRRALREGELCLYYQPKVNMRSGQVMGFEALLRWLHPPKGRCPRGFPAAGGADRPDRRVGRMGHRPGLEPIAVALERMRLVRQRQYRRPAVAAR
jgi:predicted signal transduction protein with EAL and GGDEF domain